MRHQLHNIDLACGVSVNFWLFLHLFAIKFWHFYRKLDFFVFNLSQNCSSSSFYQDEKFTQAILTENFSLKFFTGKRKETRKIESKQKQLNFTKCEKNLEKVEQVSKNTKVLKRPKLISVTKPVLSLMSLNLPKIISEFVCLQFLTNLTGFSYLTEFRKQQKL